MNGDRDGFSPPRTQELGPMSGTIYNSDKNDTLRTLFCQEASLAPQGFLVYPKYAYCTLASMCEASPVEEEKDAIRENQKVL